MLLVYDAADSRVDSDDESDGGCIAVQAIKKKLSVVVYYISVDMNTIQIRGQAGCGGGRAVEIYISKRMKPSILLIFIRYDSSCKVKVYSRAKGQKGEKSKN